MSEEMDHNHKTVTKSSTSLRNSPTKSNTHNENQVNAVKVGVGRSTKLADKGNDAKGNLSSKARR